MATLSKVEIEKAQARATEIGCTVNNGKWIGPDKKKGRLQCPYVSVGQKMQPPGQDLPPHRDGEGNLAVAVYLKSNDRYLKNFGWVPVPVPAPKPTAAKRTRKVKTDDTGTE